MKRFTENFDRSTSTVCAVEPSGSPSFGSGHTVSHKVASVMKVNEGPSVGFRVVDAKADCGFGTGSKVPGSWTEEGALISVALLTTWGIQ
jgi:hypothetical protein